MSLIGTMLAELEQELATTRRVIERVPSDRGTWKPHPKSFALGHLNQLVATMPGWITRTLRETGIDLAAGEGYGFQQPASLLEQFDRHTSSIIVRSSASTCVCSRCPSRRCTVPPLTKPGDVMRRRERLAAPGAIIG